MAHQTSNIPWNVLASNLHWSEAKHPGYGDLHLRFKPDQGKKLAYFVEGFIRNIREHSSTTRKQYPEHYDPPLPEEVILDDAIVRKITPTVRRWRTLWAKKRWHHWCDNVDNDNVDNICECSTPIPHEDRRASAFYQRYQSNRCYRFFETNGKAFYNLEVVKTLLLYGEMETILRVCAYPGVDLRTWWRMSQCYCENPDASGWESLCKMALLPYIGLNVISCFPETWDLASGKTDEKDYRRMRIYQYMLKHCTKTDMTSEVAMLPHRQFFGIADGQFNHYRSGEVRDPALNLVYPYGLMPLEKFLNWDRVVERKPAPADIPQVQRMLYSKGLPMELVLEIMALAGYEPGEGRLQVPHDPFHPENREELAKYLRFCWKVLVRCDMMAVALGMVIPWQELVSHALVQLFSCVPGRRWYNIPDRVDNPELYVFV